MTATIVFLSALLQPASPHGDFSLCDFSFHSVDAEGVVAEQPYLNQDHIESVEFVYSDANKQDALLMTLTEKGAMINWAHSSHHIGQRMALLCSGKTMVTPTIHEATKNEVLILLGR